MQSIPFGAAEKQKEEQSKEGAGYKQATPTGFESCYQVALIRCVEHLRNDPLWTLGY